MNLNKKLLSVVLTLILAINILTSCTTPLTSFEITKQRYDKSPNSKDLVSLLYISYQNDDISNLKKYGYDFFFCNNSLEETYYNEFRTFLCKKHNINRNEKDEISLHFDLILVAFQISLLYDSNLKEINDYNSVLPDFTKANALFKNKKVVVYECLASLYADELISKNFFELYISYLQFFLPYSLNNETDAMLAFIQAYSAYNNDQKSVDKYALMSIFVFNGGGFDEVSATYIYSVIKPNSIHKANVSLDEAIEYISNINLQTDLLSHKEFFGVEPSFYEKNGIFYFELKETKVIFYGVPVCLIDIVDSKTGESVYDKTINTG